MSYVDGFVLPIPKRQVAAYRRLARKAGKVWRAHGALDYVECIADDVKPGKSTSFPQSVKLKKDEVVWFSWIVFRSRRDRGRINAKVMKDPRAERWSSSCRGGGSAARRRHLAHYPRLIRSPGCEGHMTVPPCTLTPRSRASADRAQVPHVVAERGEQPPQAADDVGGQAASSAA
jgi:uncharacterized protein YbaA (DUF1428 family)